MVRFCMTLECFDFFWRELLVVEPIDDATVNDALGGKRQKIIKARFQLPTRVGWNAISSLFR